MIGMPQRFARPDRRDRAALHPARARRGKRGLGDICSVGGIVTRRSMRARLFDLSLVIACGCVPLGAPRLTREGMLAFAPRNAATTTGGVPSAEHDDDLQPQPHIARSAFDPWQPPPLGILPPGMLLRNTSAPLHVRAGALTLTLRTSDRLVPAWGGDYYVRVDLQAAGTHVTAPPRDLVVVIDTRDRAELERAQRIAASLFESLRSGDRGALVDTSDSGRAVVPLMPSAAAALLIDRTQRLTPEGFQDLSGALSIGVELLEGRGSRLRRLIVLSSSGEVVRAETRQWIEAADRNGVEVRLVPLTTRASRRLEALAMATNTVALPEVTSSARHEREAIDELAALPESEIAEHGVSIVVESEPGPMHLIEVAGSTALWTPNGSEVPLGDVAAGDRRTIVLRGMVQAWRAGEPLAVTLRVRFRGADGPHEVSQELRATYSGSPREHAGSRAGDVLQYVSLLNTLSRVQAALSTHDGSTFDSMRSPGMIQATSLRAFAQEHSDSVMFEQATLLSQLLALRP